MSSLSIAIVIVGLLILLISYAFIYQALEKRRKRRQRLISALKHRQRGFKRMVATFPAGFLTKELNLVLYRALIDACEQLSHLEPRERSHKEDFTLYSSELETLKQGEPGNRGRMESVEQVADARRQIQELHHYITQQAERGNLSKAHAQTYTDQIKRLVLQMSVDAYTMNARQAQEIGKTRLAMHYYSLARKLLIRENGGHGHQKQIIQLNDIISQLETQVARDAPHIAATQQDSPLENKEWEQFSEADERWKKKQIYD